MRNILIISTTGLGDCLWATPGVRALKKSFPDSSIDLVVRPQWKGLYFENPYIRKIFFYQPQWYYQLALLPTLLKTRYDCVLLFHANKDVGRLIPYLRFSEIWAHQSLPKIPENQILKFSKTTHPILRRAAILKKLGIESDGAQMEVFLNSKDHEEAVSFLHNNQFKTNKFVYFNIGASLPHKQWPSDRMVSLVKLFLKNTTLGIILGGGPKDAKIIRNIEKQLDQKRVIHAFHRPLRANCALIDQACLMITVDTGPMHIALAMKTPTIALFGPTRPEDSGPCQISPELCQVIQSTSTNKSNHSPAGKSGFFDSITVNTVWDKVNLILTQ